MAFWLLKTEPSTYSFDDLLREKQTTWDGIKNPAVLINIRSMKKGDLAFIYHTGGEKQIVGIAEIISEPKDDAVKIKSKSKLSRPVTLAEIKSDKTFTGWDLIRIGRLSVVKTPQSMWDRVEQLAEK